jgi:hypothetical protein
MTKLLDLRLEILELDLHHTSSHDA